RRGDGDGAGARVDGVRIRAAVTGVAVLLRAGERSGRTGGIREGEERDREHRQGDEQADTVANEGHGRSGRMRGGVQSTTAHYWRSVTRWVCVPNAPCTRTR